MKCEKNFTDSSWLQQPNKTSRQILSYFYKSNQSAYCNALQKIIFSLDHLQAQIITLKEVK